MPDSLSIAIGTVLSSLEIVEASHGHITEVTLVSLMGKPTNVIEFTMGAHRYEILINERATLDSPPQRRKSDRDQMDTATDQQEKHTQPSTSRVSLRSRMATQPTARKDRSDQLTISL